MREKQDGYSNGIREIMALEEASTAKHLTESLEPKLTEIVRSFCIKCGRCCMGESGLLCGMDEWKAILNYLRLRRMRVPRVRLLEGYSLVASVEFNYLDGIRRSGTASEQSDSRDVGASLARKTCPLLNFEDGRFECSVQPVKPAGCLAYPFWIVTEEASDHRKARRILTFKAGNLGRTPLGEDCMLGQTLGEAPILYSEYIDWLSEKLRAREGAYTLGMLNQLGQRRK